MSICRLRTPFEVSDTPLEEYPRPQFARDGYFCLNGKWEYAVLPSSEIFDGKYQGEILVPFSPEALLSGAPEDIVVTPDDTLYYKRVFCLPKGFLKARAVLHFDAVDMICVATLNGHHLGEHTGGYVPFSFDVTDALKDGENVIELKVQDLSDSSYHTRAKQALKHGGIWYTPQSGIWQSVWLESLPEEYIEDVTIIPDIDHDALRLSFEKHGDIPIEVIALDADKQIAAATCYGNEITLELKDYALWTPQDPKLYDLVFKMGSDVVKSYFGMRKFSWVTDENGLKRPGLNNKPYFMSGILDQGYWSDGMLTPPSDEAMLWDIKLVKSMGFNMLRKHIKIEPLRWYYHCDKEGILVWQDMVSGGTKYNFLYIGALAFIGINIKDNTPSSYKKLARAEAESRNEFERELEVTVKHLKNCVSLCCWVPFNEGWGQFDSARITEKIKRLDPTRLIDSVSGWNDQGKGDMRSMHIYFKPISMPRDKRCLVLSEFGGYSLNVKGHTYSQKEFGYKKYKTKASLQKAFSKLYINRILPNIKKGLSATVYTQLSDVEEEINGLVTYDRRSVKFDVEAIKTINEQLKI